MNTPLDELITRWRDGKLSDEELRSLTDALATPEGRAALRGDWFLEAALPEALRTVPVLKLAQTMGPMSTPQPTESKRWTGWLSWRPLTAATAGIILGMFCTSVVYGYVAQRAAVKRVPLPIFDPSFEATKILDKGLPHNVDEWGVRSARLVPAENGVRPLQGQHMLRMEPILLGEQDENHYSHAYQVLDLRSLPLDAVSGAMEAQVVASFCAPPGKVKARYLIRAVALNQPPATATENFWSKEENAGVVALTQRFETEAGDSSWHTFSVKMPLPHGAQSLIIILAATSPKDTTTQAVVRYLDDVQVSLLKAASDEAHP